MSASPPVGRVDRALHRAFRGRPRMIKLFKYSSASAAGVVVSQLVLFICYVLLGMSEIPSNVIAVTIGAVPNYQINRAWTFNKRGSHSLTREVVPFWLMAFLGLVLSTFAVKWAGERFDENFLAVSLANLGSFGILWVARYFILDRVLFKPLAEVIEHELEEHPDLLHHGHHGRHEAGTETETVDERERT